MGKRERKSYTIQSVGRALKLLEEFTDGAGEMGVTELSRRLGLHKNNVFRLLATLQTEGYVEQDAETNDYRLGIKTFQLGQAYLKRAVCVERARPFLEDLSRRLGETAFVGGYRDGGIYCFDSVQPPRFTRAVIQAGHVAPIHAAAIGKVQLAFGPEQDLKALLPRDLRKLTGKTLTRIEDLRAEVEKIRSDGYAVSDGELEEGLRIVAVPIREHGGGIRCGMAVAGPTFRMGDPRLKDEILPALREAALQLSRQMGAQEN